MASSIDPTKPADDVPTDKADLRANFQAAKDEIEVLQKSAILTSEHVTGNKTYVAADFPDSGPLYIIADPSSGPFTLTFPDPDTVSITTTQVKQLAVIYVINSSNDVTIACTDTAKLRSQPGTTGWDAAAHPIKAGASLALQDEVELSVTVRPTTVSGANFLKVTGPVRV